MAEKSLTLPKLAWKKRRLYSNTPVCVVLLAGVFETRLTVWEDSGRGIPMYL